MSPLRDRLEDLLGAGRPAPFGAGHSRGTAKLGGWVIEDLRFDGCEEIPALFLRPPDGHPPVPAVLYCHAHGGTYKVGRDELTGGRPALQAPWAADLAASGIAALCLEMPCFGQRRSPGEPARAKAALWRGGTLWGQMLAEQRAGLDWLAAHPMVRADRIGAMGFSMGSTLAFWLAALDPRIAAAAACCSLADLATLVGTGAHDGHGIYMTVPGLLPVARTGQIAGLAAPRPLFVGAGMRDWSTPPDAFAIARADLDRAYAAAPAAPAALTIHVEPGTGHEETPAMRAAARGFLRRHLGAVAA